MFVLSPRDAHKRTVAHNCLVYKIHGHLHKRLFVKVNQKINKKKKKPKKEQNEKITLRSSSPVDNMVILLLLLLLCVIARILPHSLVV